MVKDGDYTFRASPAVGVGGLYATGNGTFKIITVAANKPPHSEHQTWKITAVEGKKDIYYIVQVHHHEIFLGGHWSLEDNLAVPRGPVITTEAPHVEWHINPAENGIHNAYYIRPVTKAVGVGYFVGTDDVNQVVIKHFPIDSPSQIRPYWVLRESSS